MKYLKIKDDVDLKELEKFKFRPYVLIDKILYQYEELDGSQVLCNVKVNEKRILHYNCLSKRNEIPSVIYDLIKADMVEVVEDEKY